MDVTTMFTGLDAALAECARPLPGLDDSRRAAGLKPTCDADGNWRWVPASEIDGNNAIERREALSETEEIEMDWDREMQKALEADGEKLRQLTGEDHGPWVLDTCPGCDGAGEWDEGPMPASSGATEPDYRQVICPDCGGTGKAFVHAEPITLEDIA